MTLQPWQFESFDSAMQYALEWQTQGKIQHSIIKADDLYEVVRTEALSEDKEVIAQLRVILYADYMHMEKTYETFNTYDVEKPSRLRAFFKRLQEYFKF